MSAQDDVENPDRWSELIAWDSIILGITSADNISSGSLDPLIMDNLPHRQQVSSSTALSTVPLYDPSFAPATTPESQAHLPQADNEPPDGAKLTLRQSATRHFHTFLESLPLKLPSCHTAMDGTVKILQGYSPATTISAQSSMQPRRTLPVLVNTMNLAPTHCNQI